MSIVPLKKTTFVGHVDAKQDVIEELQRLGCLHLIPLTDVGEPMEDAAGPSREAREALQFLLSCPYQRRQVSDPSRFDAICVEKKALELQKQLFDLREDRDYLTQRLKNLEPWGDFAFAPLEEMGGLRLWFYVVRRSEIGVFEAVDLPWEIVSTDHQNHYVIVLSTDEPENIPIERTLSGARPPAALKARLEEVELAIEDAEAERAGLTRWCTLLARSLDGLEDHAARQYAARGTADLAPVFALQAWAPANAIDHLRDYATAHGMAFEVTDPTPKEAPPTLLSNPPALRAGEDLVNFYRTPEYHLWDPCSVVFFSFALFFAMIISDAGYGLLMGGITACLWRRLATSEKGREWRILLTTLTVFTIIYGVLTGGYFGVTPRPNTILDALHVIDINDAGAMMVISILIGGGQLILANLMDAARQRGSPAGLAPFGWALVLIGGLLLGGQLVIEALPAWPGAVAMGGGFLLILLFAGYGERPLGRALRGVMALTRLTKAFGDVLSYLRLFALGLASASLAVAFNDMAAGVRETLPGIGLLFALLVLIVGHALNFVLAIASGVIHGLRLNLIEFFDWGVQDEGNLFRAFRRKGST